MMCYAPYNPPWFLQNGIAMTVYTALWGIRYWESTIKNPEPQYHKTVLTGGQDVPIFCWVAIPKNAHSTIIGTYGITGELGTQWFLRILGRKAYAEGYAVVLFDWRAHGKTADLSPTLMSDGLYEGRFRPSSRGGCGNGMSKELLVCGVFLRGTIGAVGFKSCYGVK